MKDSVLQDRFQQLSGFPSTGRWAFLSEWQCLAVFRRCDLIRLGHGRSSWQYGHGTPCPYIKGENFFALTATFSHDKCNFCTYFQGNRHSWGGHFFHRLRRLHRIANNFTWIFFCVFCAFFRSLFRGICVICGLCLFQ